MCRSSPAAPAIRSRHLAMPRLRNAAIVSATVLAALLVWPSCVVASAGAAPGQGNTAREQTSGGPRLVRVSRGAFTAHILPESHLGTRIEQDAYFRTRVMPAARQATVMIHEFADLQALPGSPSWGQTCLELDRALMPMSQRLIKGLLTHHRFSQWSDLRRVFAENDPATVDQMFESFLRSRGMMLNFWDLFFNVYGGLEREIDRKQWALQTTTPDQPKQAPSPKRAITRSIPHLGNESIESLEDLSAAVCKLRPDEQALLLEDALQSIENIEQELGSLPSDHFEAQALVTFDLMRLQQGFGALRRPEALRPLLTPNLRVKSDSPESLRMGLSRNPATDQLLLRFRNIDWASKIEGHAAANRRGLIYVFGAAHLIDFDRFDGLLTLLKQRGFRIELVR